MNFCSNCGSPVQHTVPAGDDRPRFVCGACGAIHYRNPKLVVGCIPESGDRILLCRRAIEPRYGTWTIPAGYLEEGETVSQGAVRETLEEAGAQVENLKPYALLNLAFISQVYFIFRGRLLDHHFVAGGESLEVGLFREEDIPWRSLAFKVIHEALRLYYEDRANGAFLFHMGDIERG
jgi:ADP-ribose pyrophosphatase YjhB (NUDIX family)